MRRVLTFLAVPVLAVLAAVASNADDVIRLAAQEGDH